MKPGDLVFSDAHLGLALGDHVEADPAHLALPYHSRPRGETLLADILCEVLELALVEAAQERDVLECAQRRHEPSLTRRRARHGSQNQKRPRVPGPPCVPITGPSVVTMSTDACGLAACTRRTSSSQSSRASAWPTPTCRFGSSWPSVEPRKISSSSPSAFARPRTRLSCATSPSSKARMGFTERSCPARPAAFPIRPPRTRYSSVSTVKRRPRSRWKRSTTASTSSSSAPRSSRRWIASVRITVPPEVTFESSTRTFPPKS